MPHSVPSLVERKTTLDAKFLDIDVQSGSFGGFYIENGQIRIQLTDLDKTAENKFLVENLLRDLPDTDYVGITFDMVDFGYTTLVQWRALISSIPGVISTDIDERDNALRIGVLNESVRGDVENLLRDQQIPQRAVTIELASYGRDVAVTTLTDKVRPVKGGLRITGSTACSSGFVARQGGSKVLVTAGHCTPELGVLDSTLFYQATEFGTNTELGNEISDPPFTSSSGCPTNKVCRSSDSALVELSSALSDVGEIYLTSGANTGSIQIADSAGVILTGTAVVGKELGKVGWRTGWTTGEITQTCVDLTWDPGEILTCQHFTDISVQGGDSGSPVFSGPTGGTGSIVLYGIIWGGGEDSGRFSSYDGIEGDHGSLTPEHENCSAYACP